MELKKQKSNNAKLEMQLRRQMNTNSRGTYGNPQIEVSELIFDAEALDMKTKAG